MSEDTQSSGQEPMSERIAELEQALAKAELERDAARRGLDVACQMYAEELGHPRERMRESELFTFHLRKIEVTYYQHSVVTSLSFENGENWTWAAFDWGAVTMGYGTYEGLPCLGGSE